MTSEQATALPAAGWTGASRGERDLLPVRHPAIVPGSPILGTRPKNFHLPEAAGQEPINMWIGSVFDPAQGTTR